MSRPRSFSGLVIIVCAIVAGAAGRQVLSAQNQLDDQYRLFSEALTAIEQRYVADAAVTSDRLIYSALGGVMRELDPHSHVMDPRSFAEDRQRLEGRYYGIGVSIQSIAGRLSVNRVFEGSPAYQAGVRRGDVITQIGGNDTTGWTTEQASARLKGSKGTRIGIAVRRISYDDPIELQVTRDEVRMPTVAAAVMLDASTGYIKLQEFGDESDRELGDAIAALSGRGMKRLVFDLRDNPGGVLPQAILVANRFLPRGSLIVSTRGRVRDSDADYRAERAGNVTVPMVTLVNRDSASASEIVSGALQDHDRSLIVGETTFGKALVQTVYRVSEGAGAAITTAKYYTPSGRLIQRPWDASFDEYLTYAGRDQQGSTTHRAEDLKKTDSGRSVYSGGGVEPDRRFNGSWDGFNPTLFGRTLAARGLFEIYAQRFVRTGDTRVTLAPAAATQTVGEGFVVTDAMMASFKDLVTQSGVRIDAAGWNADAAYIRAMIHKEVDLDLFGAAAAYRNLADRDPQLQFAVTLFPEAQTLLESSRRDPRL